VKSLRELPIPDGVETTKDPDEVIRLWIGDGESFVTLNNYFGANAHVWGMMLADIAGQVANMLHLQEGLEKEGIYREIEQGYRGRMEQGLKAIGRNLNPRH
jgi:Domain of unknown function (DUF5076)